MKIIADLLNKFKTLGSKMTDGSILDAIIMRYEDEICEMNTQDQLYEHGQNRLGVDIADYAPYTDFTIEYKHAKGQPTNRVTLRDTGDFYRSFYVSTNGKSFKIHAKDWKTEDLEAKYGSQIFGLSDENIQSLKTDYLLPGLIEETKNILLNK